MLPQTAAPSFTAGGFVAITIPVAFLILSNDIAVALAALRKKRLRAARGQDAGFFQGSPLRWLAFFGGHAANVGGMMSAVCSQEEAGPKEKRYWAAVISGGIVVLFGLFAWAAIAVIEVLPMPFITIIAGFALVGVLMNSLQSAFFRFFLPLFHCFLRLPSPCPTFPFLAWLRRCGPFCSEWFRQRF